MCNITFFKPGQMMSDTMLQNVCWNNWHSFGFVARVDGGLEITRSIPKPTATGEGEIDWREIKELLLKYKDHERFLHVRHQTAGGVTMENVHPFDVCQNDEDHVTVMHNGTMDAFKSMKATTEVKNGTTTTTYVTDMDGPSDTKNFCDQVIQPYLELCHSDITHKLFRRTLWKEFPAERNRMVIISATHPAFFLGAWKEVPAADGDGVALNDKLKTSNDDYFKGVVRGPEFLRRKAEEEKAKLAKKHQASGPKVGTSKKTGVTSLSNAGINQRHPFLRLSESPCKLINDWDMYDRAHAVCLGALTSDELEELYKDKDAMLAVAGWIFADYYALYSEFEELEKKHKAASNMIGELKAKALAA